MHYHILLSNIVSWVDKRHIDLRVNYRNFKMLKASINISNTFLCDSLLCIHSSKNGLRTVYLIVWNILGIVYPEMSIGGGGGSRAPRGGGGSHAICYIVFLWVCYML